MKGIFFVLFLVFTAQHAVSQAPANLRVFEFKKGLEFIEEPLGYSCDQECIPLYGRFTSDADLTVLVFEFEKRIITLRNGLSKDAIAEFPLPENFSKEQIQNAVVSDIDADTISEVVFINSSLDGLVVIALEALKLQQWTYRLPITVSSPRVFAFQLLEKITRLVAIGNENQSVDYRLVSDDGGEPLEIHVWKNGEIPLVPEGFWSINNSIVAFNPVSLFVSLPGYPLADKHVTSHYSLNDSAVSLDQFVVGDFNGDGFPDIVVDRGVVKGLGAVLGSERGLIPQKLNRRLSEYTLRKVFDADVDGLDDILAESRKSGTKVLLRSKSATPVDSEVLRNSEFRTALTTSMESLFGYSEKLDTSTHLAWVSKIITQASPLRVVVVLYPKQSSRGQPVDVGGRLDDRLAGPFVCDGFNPEMPSPFGIVRECATGYVLYALDDSGRFGRDGRLIGGGGVCCRLPKADILDVKTSPVIAEVECPQDSVVVALVDKHDGEGEMLKCAQINSEKYSLSELADGAYWGTGTSQAYGESFVSERNIPLAFFLGLRRQLRTSLDIDGCVAQTPGALLTRRRTDKPCTSAGFRQLLEKQPSGTVPVQMFPRCTSSPDPVDPAAGCELEVVQ